MDAGGRKQLERLGDEEQGRLVYKFRVNSPLLDLKDIFCLQYNKSLSVIADGRCGLLKRSVFSWGGREVHTVGT